MAWPLIISQEANDKFKILTAYMCQWVIIVATPLFFLTLCHKATKLLHNFRSADIGQAFTKWAAHLDTLSMWCSHMWHRFDKIFNLYPLYMQSLFHFVCLKKLTKIWNVICRLSKILWSHESFFLKSICISALQLLSGVCHFPWAKPAFMC